MKIKFLGTAAFEGIPALFCSCDVCKESRALGGRNIRMRSSALVDDKVALDFTNDTLSHIIKYNLDFSKLEHLFITHSHSDHFNYHDLEAKLKWFTNSGNPVLNVYANESSIKLAKTYLANHGDIDSYLNFQTIKHFNSIKADNYIVTPIPARHITEFSGEDSSVYIIEHDGKKVLYGLDSGWYFDETWEYLESIHLDCLIMDCTNGFLQFEAGNHMGFGDNLKIMKRLMKKGAIDDDTTLVSTHFSHNGKVVYDKHCKEFEKQGIIMSYDGMEINI